MQLQHYKANFGTSFQQLLEGINAISSACTCCSHNGLPTWEWEAASLHLSAHCMALTKTVRLVHVFTWTKSVVAYLAAVQHLASLIMMPSASCNAVSQLHVAAILKGTLALELMQHGISSV